MATSRMMQTDEDKNRNKFTKNRYLFAVFACGKILYEGTKKPIDSVLLLLTADKADIKKREAAVASGNLLVLFLIANIFVYVLRSHPRHGGIA